MMLPPPAPMLEEAKAAIAAANDRDPAETIGRDQDDMFLNHPGKLARHRRERKR